MNHLKSRIASEKFVLALTFLLDYSVQYIKNYLEHAGERWKLFHRLYHSTQLNVYPYLLTFSLLIFFLVSLDEEDPILVGKIILFNNDGSLTMSLVMNTTFGKNLMERLMFDNRR